ncbi:MAG: poly-gamma-glutamate hydrolase family protein, partial [Candidatus Obscuribacterales bacterium]|nr:poly-gamma-glutamate hydrolase family protein [Candidatus Obscuribacterales bacterium]
IEPGSSYIARAVAGSQLNLYDFQGLRRRRPQELHVTSTRFRDRRLNDLLLHTRIALSIHSMGEQGSGEIWIGGLNLELKQRVCDQLSLSGFVVNGDSPRYRGVHPANIVNLASEHGVQIELSGNVIAAMFAMEGPPFGRRVTQLPTTERFDAFVGAVRSAMGLEAAA